MIMVGASEQQSSLEAQLQATLNVIPAHTCYAGPSGVLTFVNTRIADYLCLPNNHPLRLGIDLGADWDSPIPPNANREDKPLTIDAHHHTLPDFVWRRTVYQGDRS